MHYVVYMVCMIAPCNCTLNTRGVSTTLLYNFCFKAIN